MTQKPAHQQIFLWFEIIIAVRVLLFVAPVLIYKFQEGIAWGGARDGVILGTGLISLAYFLAGVFSLSGYRRWRILQYLAAAVTIVLAAVFFSAKAAAPGVDLKAVVPAGISVLVILYIYLTGRRPVA